MHATVAIATLQSPEAGLFALKFVCCATADRRIICTVGRLLFCLPSCIRLPATSSKAKEAKKEQERIELLTHMKEVGTTLLDKAGQVLCQHFPNLERTIMADAAALPPLVPSPSWWQATSAVHADVRTPI